MLKKNVQKVLKIIIALVITYGVCWILSISVSYITYHYLMKKYLKTWSIYEGFIDDFFLLYSCLLSFYVLNLKRKKVTFISIVFYSMVFLTLDFIIDFYEDYDRFYVNTTINGPYSYDIFKYDFVSSINFFQFNSYHYLSFMVHNFCCLLTIATIAILSMLIKNKLIEKRLISDHSSILKR
jgi:hypothetical protein